MLLQHFQQPLWEIVPEKVVIVTLIHNSSIARIPKCLGTVICADNAPSGRDKKWQLRIVPDRIFRTLSAVVMSSLVDKGATRSVMFDIIYYHLQPMYYAILTVCRLSRVQTTPQHDAHAI